MTLAQVDRFVFPAGDPGIASYLFERLFAPHNLRERLRRSAGLAVRVAKPLPEDMPAVEKIDAALRSLDLAASRWLLVEDYSGNERNRIVVFLFGEGEASPSAVLKLGSGLQREAEALRFLAGHLPAELRDSVPRLLSWQDQALLMSPVPGVSAYVEMQGLLAPGRAVDRHFDAAAEWLFRFHEATGASHGDFWARNLLIGPTAVVDWEHFTEEAPIYADLFHFPLTYGLNYPWERWRRLPPDEAFRRTFLEDNRVSRAVRRYLARFGDPAALRPPFEAWLENGQYRDLLGRAGRSVFSG
ncbi:MAG TPA: hypothetical protein VNM67_03360 [Thermoanaerobaculia bacterium]|jgi:hypothetical protein|nr:hypothetical protein [Thermoanaerobaculia bacterium]